MLFKKKKKNKTVKSIKDATFYAVTYDQGLSSKQVEERIKDNLITNIKKRQ